MTQIARQTDHLLKVALDAELAASPDVDADGIGVAVADGAVTLSGQVRSYPEQIAAVRAAQRVGGVTAVADEIVVKTHWGERLDSDIARDAGDALASSVVLPPGAVKASVHHHTVNLTGSVAWQFEREAAERAVAGIHGVTAVRNGIQLTPREAFTRIVATQRIEAALVRSARLDAKRITVTSVGSRIDLTGTVGSWSEFREAGHAAWSTPGVTGVENRLRVLT